MQQKETQGTRQVHCPGLLNKHLITIKDLTNYCNLTEKYIRNLLKRGVLSGVQLPGNGKWLIRRTSVCAFFQSLASETAKKIHKKGKKDETSASRQPRC